MTDAEKTRALIEKSAGLLAQRIRDDVPETGKFKTYFYTFDIPGTQNEGYLSVEYWEPRGPEQRGVRLGAFRSGTNMLVSYYMKVGTNAELIAYLEDPETPEDWCAQIRKLSDSVDDRW